MARAGLTIEQVQQWVMSFLVLAVALFPLGAMVAAVAMLEADARHGDALLICALMAVLGTVALVVVRLIHRVSPVHWTVVLGFIPAAATALIVF